jgi:hypothetical protein
MDQALGRLLAPLNSEWIAFMALPWEHQSEIFKRDEFFNEWYYNDWEAVTINSSRANPSHPAESI